MDPSVGVVVAPVQECGRLVGLRPFRLQEELSNRNGTISRNRLAKRLDPLDLVHCPSREVRFPAMGA
jgi:hypothetical protein